ncbi:MAG: ABC transporter permease [Pirellulales bacterium]
MIFTVIWISLQRLRHNKAELLLTFVVPIIFFSIFACIFGARGETQSRPATKIVICDTVDSDASRRLAAGLSKEESLQVRRLRLDRDQSRRAGDSQKVAEQLLRRGHAAAVVLIQPSTAGELDVQVFADSFDQVASKIVAPAVQKTLAAESWSEQVEALQQAQARAVRLATSTSTHAPVQLASAERPLEAAGGSAPSPTVEWKKIPEVRMRDVLGESKSNPVIAMYAAGIAVMFLLFSAVTSGGSLLEERENATLDRLLCSRLTMDQLLLGKWCYLSMMGFMQTLLMFVVGAVCFGLDLVGHCDGFLIMTIVTSGSAAGFALMLAAVCRSRAQLGWVSTVVILAMSALGGSMVPRYLMSEQIRRIGGLTFNAWALDGYNKVFWRELPVGDLAIEVAVLSGCALLFMIIARTAAARWERV